MKATIFNIQRCCVNDGPGIRTTVFIKGCPLRCRWCHNPESNLAFPQLMLNKNRCIGCGECVKACKDGLHSFVGGEHLIDRGSCRSCWACVDACIGAIERCGTEMSVDDVLDEVRKDKPFYQESGGGMTVSGGEPLMHPEFLLELVKRAKAEGISVCIETSGYAEWSVIESLLPFVDVFLYDIKETDEARHLEYTGVSNRKILDNLAKLNESGASVVIRAPIIPNYNDRKEHLLSLGELAEKYESVIRVDVEPYHPLGKSKSEALGVEYKIEDLSFAADERVREWISVISSATKKPVVKS